MGTWRCRRRLAPFLACLLGTCLTVTPAPATELVPAGHLLPLAVRNGRCECLLPTEEADAKYFLILNSLADGPAIHRVRVCTEAATEPALVPPEVPADDAAWRQHVQDCALRQAWARRQPSLVTTYPAAPEPPRQRTFYLFTRDHDFEDATGYTAIHGDLRGVGRFCQVYVDRDHPDKAALQPTVDDIVRTFDQEVYPWARRAWGQALDVDRDGRFTMLLSGWLGKLQDGKVALGGFVRGSDFYRDLQAPFGNRCDMMYLNTDLVPGAHLHTVLAHEYTHAIVFTEHVFGQYLPQTAGRDEESWLNEALAHLAEDLHGYSWSNLDYRVSAFLNAPERYQLVVADSYRAGLWRSPGNRGASYLFLRWCVERYGPDLAARLIRSNLSGVANLEAGTQEHFAELFRQWSAALLLAGTGLCQDASLDGSALSATGEGTRLLPRFVLYSPAAQPGPGFLLGGPHSEEMVLNGGRHELTLAGTSAAYLLLHSPGAPRCHLTIEAEPGTALQVSLLRLPQATSRLSLRQQPGSERGTVRLVVEAHDGPALLEGAAWERVVPGPSGPQDTSYRPGDGRRWVQAWFGDTALRAGEVRTSPPIPLPPGKGDFVFKVTGSDGAGHRLAAWTQ